MSIVAISQALGSLGDEIGRGLASALGYDFVDREILLQAAERSGKGVTTFQHVTEERPSLWERFADTTRRYRIFVEAIVWETAARDNVVIAGRGAPFVLAAVSHALRVRITASEKARAKRVERRLGIGAEAAVDLVRQSDRERAARVKFLYHGDWEGPLRYDLVLNTDRVDERLAIRIVQDALENERFQPTPESVQAIRDQALAARARVALLLNPATQPLQLSVECAAGHVTLRGIAPREEHRRSAEESVRSLSGVAAVVNEIVVTSPPRYPVGV